MTRTSTKFIILRDSVEQASWVALSSGDKEDPTKFLGTRFTVVQGGWKPNLEKVASAEKTIGGHLDVSVGHIWRTAEYIVRCKDELETSEDDTIGVIEDLRAYFMLNNPKASPSNIIYLVDHYNSGTVEKVGVATVMLGSFSEQPLSVIISGTSAHFTVNVAFMCVTAETYGVS